MSQIFRRVRIVLAAFALVVICSACSTQQVDRRITYWKAETDKDLPIGSTLDQAEKFFETRGVKLNCCVSQPPAPSMYFMLERNIGHAFWMEYDVVVLVEVAKEKRVSKVQIERWGIGL